jgi:hypothetical protein
VIGGDVDGLAVEVAREDLVLGPATVGSGGQSDRLSVCEGTGYLLKRYLPETRAALRPDALVAMVEWRRALPDADRAELDRRCAWPLATVTEPDGSVGGILIAAAPRSMWQEFRRPGTLSVLRKPRHIADLTFNRAEAARLGLDYHEPPVKLAVLAQLFDTAHWLHERGYVVGDLQPRNALFSVSGPQQQVLLIDCDSCAPATGRDAAFAPLDPEIWKLPDAGPFSVASDHYKFAWAVVRCLQENLEAVAVDHSRLRRYLDDDALRLIDASCAGWHTADLAAIWHAKTHLWSRLVTADALYVRTSVSLRVRWTPGLDVRPTPPTPLLPPQAAPPRRRRWWRRKKKRTP